MSGIAPSVADILDLLACPADHHSPLRVVEVAGGDVELECTGCLSRFPVRDGIPVLLLDDALPGPNGFALVEPADPAAEEDASAGSGSA